MGLTPSQMARASALEASQARLTRLGRMSAGQLRALLGGELAEAAAWIAGAADCGLPAAQLCLGRMLLTGQGVERDAAAAWRWFRRAADQGDAEAMNMVGRCLENGWGVAPDAARAAHTYRCSAEAGHDWGQYNLGNLLFDGRGLPQDQREALRWYLRAAQQGHDRAMNLVGRCLEEGWGCRASPPEAAYWYRRSAEAGYFRGQFNHALVLVQDGQPTLAAPWFWKAALGGDADMRRAIIAALGSVCDARLCEVAERVRGMPAN